MITFLRLRYQNFLSTGSLFTEIDLSATPTTLIVGMNGSGKSTFIDALCYVLYGKPFRQINKPKLVNSITQKGLLVEVQFEIGPFQYLVRRGQKPNLFEIYRGDIDHPDKSVSLINQTSGVIEYQDILEKQILKMSFKAFIQIVILGSTNYVPFMRLVAQGRREVIEDILDIQVFSLMNKLLKDKVDQNKQDFIEINYKIEFCQNKIKMNKMHLEALKEKDASYIIAREKAIERHQQCILTRDRILLARKDLLVVAQGNYEVLEMKLKRLDEFITIQKNLYSKINLRNHEIIVYQTLPNCPTCKQSLGEEFRATILQDKLDEYKKLTVAKIEVDKELEVYNVVSQELDKAKQTVNYYKKCIQESEFDINQFKMLIEREKAEILKSREEKSKLIEPKEDFENELKQLNQKKATLLEEREIYAASTILLKDGGIKTKIVQQYVPVMNEFINKYLEAMDLFVSFCLDDSFNETIKSRFRDEFTYESFSEGEKLRINLAILFAWLEIAKLRNSSSCNLLIMDEILDGSLDLEGADALFKLIQDISKNRNIFVISHKWNMQDKFNRVLEFKKSKNFSRIAA